MLAPPADVDRLPPLSDSQITDLVADYEVESEQTSTVRYIGKLAFRYRLDAVGALLQQNGVSAAAGRARRSWSCRCWSGAERTCYGAMAMPGAMPGRRIRRPAAWSN